MCLIQHYSVSRSQVSLINAVVQYTGLYAIGKLASGVSSSVATSPTSSGGTGLVAEGGASGGAAVTELYGWLLREFDPEGRYGVFYTLVVTVFLVRTS